MKKLSLTLLTAILMVVVALGAIFTYWWFDVPNERQMVNAARIDDLETLKRIAAKGVSLDAQEQGMQGFTPLVASTLTPGTNVFFYLLSAGANVNARDRMGETALMTAVCLGDANLVKIKALIDAGADVNASNRGITILRTAEFGAQGGHPAVDTITLLKQHGAKE